MEKSGLVGGEREREREMKMFLSLNNLLFTVL
jgi:hypothetical protein